MRRIVAFDQLSADGYFAAPDGNLNWVVPDPEMAKAAEAGMSQLGAILFGRRTYEMFAQFWPQAAESPAPASPHGGQTPEQTKAMGVFFTETPKLVFSRTLKDPKWKNTRVLAEFDARQVESLKNEPGNDMMIFGSGKIASLLTRHRLIDEYQLLVCPVLLGGGKTLLNGMPESLKLKLLEAKPLPTGNVMLRYAPA